MLVICFFVLIHALLVENASKKTALGVPKSFFLQTVGINLLREKLNHKFKISGNEEWIIIKLEPFDEDISKLIQEIFYSKVDISIDIPFSDKKAAEDKAYYIFKILSENMPDKKIKVRFINLKHHFVAPSSDISYYLSLPNEILNDKVYIKLHPTF